jgi:dTDP-glucose pyrophosphorylase
MRFNMEPGARHDAASTTEKFSRNRNRKTWIKDLTNFIRCQAPIHTNIRIAFSELEITDVNKRYLEMGQLNVEMMRRGFAWLDTGTHDSLLEAAGFIATLQKRQGLMVACPEEIAYRQGWIGAEQVMALAQPFIKTAYGQYLVNMLQE